MLKGFLLRPFELMERMLTVLDSTDPSFLLTPPFSAADSCAGAHCTSRPPPPSPQNYCVLAVGVDGVFLANCSHSVHALVPNQDNWIPLPPLDDTTNTAGLVMANVTTGWVPTMPGFVPRPSSVANLVVSRDQENAHEQPWVLARTASCHFLPTPKRAKVCWWTRALSATSD